MRQGKNRRLANVKTRRETGLDHVMFISISILLSAANSSRRFSLITRAKKRS